MWVALDGARVQGGIADSIGEVRARTGEAAWLGIDMPLGFADPPSVGRRCERAARDALGSRRSSVFPTLPLECYQAPYEERAAVGARLGMSSSYSKQAWNLRGGIFDVQQHLDARMFETHPELAFATRSGRELEPKRTTEGVDQRTAIVTREGLDVAELIDLARAPIDDILDAAICAVVARERADGMARYVPADADPHHESVIWY